MCHQDDDSTSRISALTAWLVVVTITVAVGAQECAWLPGEGVLGTTGNVYFLTLLKSIDRQLRADLEGLV